MRILLTLAAAIICLPLWGQIKPNDFTEATSISNADFEFYSQKADSSRRASVITVKKAMVPDMDRTRAAAPDTTGNLLNLMEFLLTPGDSLYYIDAEGDAALLYDPTQGIQTLSFSGDSVYISGVAAGVYIGSVNTDNQGIDTSWVSGDTLYLSLEDDGVDPFGIDLSAITGAMTGATTGANGISIVTTTASLATDTLTSDVTWTSRGSSGVFKIKPYTTSNNIQFLSNESAMSIGSNRAYDIFADTFRSSYIQANGNWTIYDLRSTTPGIQYAADYSLNFTDRSIVDKEYVDDRIDSLLVGAGTDDQTLTYSNDTLTIEDGNSVVLSTASKARFNTLVVSNSLGTGTEDTVDLNFEFLPNLWTHNRFDTNFIAAYPDTSLAGSPGYTTVPNAQIGHLPDDGNGADRTERHGNVAYWFNYLLASASPIDTFTITYATKGGVLSDSIINLQPYRDSIINVVNNAVLAGATKFDYVIAGFGTNETSEAYIQNLLNLYYLLDSLQVIDDRTIFMSQTPGPESTPMVGGGIRQFAEARDNWVAIPMADLPQLDGNHFTGTSYKIAGHRAYRLALTAAATPTDTTYTYGWGRTRHTGIGSRFAWTWWDNEIPSSFDSIQASIMLLPNSRVSSSGFHLGNAVINLATSRDTVSAISYYNNVIYGVDNIPQRDSIGVFGVGNDVTKDRNLAFGFRNTVGNTGSGVFGNDRTTNRNYQYIIGRTDTDYIILGSQEFNISDSLTVSDEGDYWTWDNSTRTWITTPAPCNVTSGTTDGVGDLTVTHNLGATPVAVVATAQGTTPYICTVHTIGATTFKVRVSDATGAAVLSTSVTIHWCRN